MKANPLSPKLPFDPTASEDFANAGAGVNVIMRLDSLIGGRRLESCLPRVGAAAKKQRLIAFPVMAENLNRLMKSIPLSGVSLAGDMVSEKSAFRFKSLSPKLNF